MKQQRKIKLSVRLTWKRVILISAFSVTLFTGALFLFFNTSNVHPAFADEGAYELAFFTATLKGGSVTFSWATDTETNNDYFSIERSTDGIHFTEMKRQPGAGNSNHRMYYMDIDENLVEGYAYYRLKQTDFNGNARYSEIKTIKFKPKDIDNPVLKLISIAPNPFSENCTISFILQKIARVDFVVVNSSGQVVFKDIIITNDGMNQYNFANQEKLAAGVYYISLVYEESHAVYKVIKS